MIIVAFLKWETTYASIPGDVSGQITSLIRLGGTGWFPILVMFLVGFTLFAVAVGPDKWGEWRKAASDRWHSSTRQIEQLGADKKALQDELAEAKRDIKQLGFERDMLRGVLTPTEASAESMVVPEIIREGPRSFTSVTLAPKATVRWPGPRGPAPGHYTVPYSDGAPAVAFRVEGAEYTYRIALAYEVRGRIGPPDHNSSDLGSSWTIETTAHIQVLDKDGNEVRYPTVYVGRASISEDGSFKYGVSCDWILSDLPEGVYTLNVFDHAEGTGGVNMSESTKTIGAREYRNMRLKVTKVSRIIDAS